MADKIVILKDGVIEQQGSPLDVYDRPANLFVAQFIGSPSMNLLKGEATANGVRLASGTLLPLPRGHKAKPGQKVTYGIRPEHLEPGPGIAATVSVTEPTGPEIHIYADIDDEEVCAITEERVAPARGTAISLAPRLDRVHLFDTETGKALV